MATLFLEPTGTSFSGGFAGAYGISDSTTRSQTALNFAVGTLAKDASGGRWVHVKSGAAISAGEAVVQSTLLSDVRKSAAVAAQGLLGIAVAAFASGDFGWIQIGGTAAGCKCESTVVANSLVCPSQATAGRLKEIEGSSEALGQRGARALTAAVTNTCTIYMP